MSAGFGWVSRMPWALVITTNSAPVSRRTWVASTWSWPPGRPWAACAATFCSPASVCAIDSARCSNWSLSCRYMFRCTT